MVFFFFFFSLLTGSVERLRIGLSLSYVYSRPLYIYTNIKRYRTQTVDFPTPSFPYSSQTVWGFVIFPSDCININIFSIYFMDGIFSIFFIIFYFSTSFILMDSQPSVVVIPPSHPVNKSLLQTSLFFLNQPTNETKPPRSSFPLEACGRISPRHDAPSYLIFISFSPFFVIRVIQRTWSHPASGLVQQQGRGGDDSLLLFVVSLSACFVTVSQQ